MELVTIIRYSFAYLHYLRIRESELSNKKKQKELSKLEDLQYYLLHNRFATIEQMEEVETLVIETQPI